MARLVNRQPQPTVTWRGTITDTAEITAFAHRGKLFKSHVGTFLSTLLVRLGTIRADAADGKTDERRRDLVTELTIVNALEFLAGLNLWPMSLPQGEVGQFYRSGRREPPQLLMVSGRAESAVQKLTRVGPPSGYRLSRIWRALADPMAVADDTLRAWRSGLRLEWAIAALT